MTSMEGPGQDGQAAHAIDKLGHSSKTDILTSIFIAFLSAKYLS